jgi:phosphatidylinositol alpha-1,6-mannosyltransferase
MERLGRHIVEAFSESFEVHVIGPDGCRRYLPSNVTCIEVPVQPLGVFLCKAAFHALREAAAFEPDITFAGSALTAPMAWVSARLARARSYAYVHGLDLVAPHAAYRLIWLPYVRLLDGVVANSRATSKIAEQVGVASERIRVVHPGVTMPEPLDGAGGWFRSTYGVGERPMLLSVGRLTRRKGLTHFVSRVLPRIAREKPNVCLCIVGDVPKGALIAQAEAPEQILRTARLAGVSQNVCWLGYLPDQVLHTAYAASDVHVFPVQELPNDPEGFGMVALEAAAWGTPTVAYAVGGVVDAVAHGVSGFLVEPGDSAAFAEAVLGLMERPMHRQKVRRFAESLAWPRFNKAIVHAVGDG